MLNYTLLGLVISRIIILTGPKIIIFIHLSVKIILFYNYSYP